MIFCISETSFHFLTMQLGSLQMTKNNQVLSIQHLRMLLTSIVDHKLQVCVRFRMLGQMWQPNHMRVLKLTEKGVILNDEINNKMVTVPDLSQVMQFELDSSLYQYEPHNHYEVNPHQ
jgi:hypothetical protein